MIKPEAGNEVERSVAAVDENHEKNRIGKSVQSEKF
jgi:hypothetical protein